jgi:hypothetical protein
MSLNDLIVLIAGCMWQSAGNSWIQWSSIGRRSVLLSRLHLGGVYCGWMLRTTRSTWRPCAGNNPFTTSVVFWHQVRSSTVGRSTITIPMKVYKKELSWNYYIYLPLTFIPEGVAEATQVLLRDAHVLAKLFSCEELLQAWQVESLSPSDRSL